MLKIFKTNNLIAQVLMLLGLVIVLWGGAFVNPEPMAPGENFAPLYDWLYDHLSPFPRLCTLLGLLLVVGEGILLNYILNEFKLLPNNTMLPMFLYVLLMSFSGNLLTVNSFLICNLFVILAVGQLFTSGVLVLPFNKTFNASMFLGIAILLDSIAATLLLFLLLVIVVYRLYSWRDIVVILLGLLAPYILFFTWMFLIDRLEYSLYLMVYSMEEIHLILDFSNMPLAITHCILLVMILASMVVSIGDASDNTAIFRRNAAVINSLNVVAFAALLYGLALPFNTQIFAIVFAFMGTIFFLSPHRRNWIFEVLMGLLIVMSIVNCYL